MRRVLSCTTVLATLTLLAATAAFAHHKPDHEQGPPDATPTAAAKSGGGEKAKEGKGKSEGRGKSESRGGSSGVGAQGAGNTAGAGNSINQGRHTICHATGSESNPYVLITPARAGVFNGHMGGDHQAGEDIIPPMQYDANRDGTFETYSQNWDSAGQAIFNAGCEVPEQQAAPAIQPTGGIQAGGQSAGEIQPAGEVQAGGVKGAVHVGAEEQPGGVAGAVAGAERVLGANLPFTGLPVWIALLAAAGLLAGGLALRSTSRGTAS